MAARGVSRPALAVLLLAGACAAPPADAPKPAPAVAPTPAPFIPPPSPVDRAPEAAAPARSSDTCGAAALQYLIGRPRLEIPIPLSPGARRVVCTTCPVTQDYLPGRQTITYDPATGLVTSVKCG